MYEKVVFLNWILIMNYYFFKKKMLLYVVYSNVKEYLQASVCPIVFDTFISLFVTNMD